ncbi:MAG: lysine--tRNA ligase [Candidatus Giovannonibacteria bacterium]|nr:MAG: lysine--tRNA ligase [Candidatus Giovannonibacteria bacterium]
MSSSGEEIRKHRVRKTGILRSFGIDPYPAAAPFALTEISAVKKNFKKRAAAKKSVCAAGRIMAKRGHGGAVFFDIFDGSNPPAGGLAAGGRIQIFMGEDKVGAEPYKLFADAADVGDFVAVCGRPFYTKKREPTIEAARWQMLAKSFLPLPEKWHGLQDIEERFRKRYLDVLMNPEVMERFLLRSGIVRNLRNILDKENYIEVETPILQPIYGGALAEPFKTRHRMLEMDMYLRIAPELYLKRLLAAGFNKIYEIGKNFRNEGLDATHNPEFTTVELYAAYKDAAYLRDFISETLEKLIKSVLGAPVFKFEGKALKFPKKVPTIKFWQTLERYALLPGAEKLNREDLALRAKQFGINSEGWETKEKISDEIFKKICRPKMTNPVYVVDYPIEMSPLAKNLPDGKAGISGNPKIVDRFQLIVGGLELANGFSELNDPEEQRRRLEAQEKLRAAENKEAHPMDEEFIEMLEYGMPPAAGLAVSIDRLAMLLTNTHNIKEVIIFPTMKPK